MNNTRRTFTLLLAALLLMSMLPANDALAKGIKTLKPSKPGKAKSKGGKNNKKNNNKKKPAPKAPKADPIKRTITTGYMKSRTGMTIHIFAKVALPASKKKPAPKPKTREILMEITLHPKTKVTLDGKNAHISKIKPEMYLTIDYATMKGHDKKIAVTIDAQTEGPEQKPEAQKTAKKKAASKKTPAPEKN